MKTFFQIIQILISILLTLFILMQSRGAGLSAAFGGTGGFYTSKRGVEKILYQTTVVLAVLFLLISFVTALVHE